MTCRLCYVNASLYYIHLKHTRNETVNFQYIYFVIHLKLYRPTPFDIIIVQCMLQSNVTILSILQHMRHNMRCSSPGKERGPDSPTGSHPCRKDMRRMMRQQCRMRHFTQSEDDAGDCFRRRHGFMRKGFTNTHHESDGGFPKDCPRRGPWGRWRDTEGQDSSGDGSGDEGGVCNRPRRHVMRRMMRRWNRHAHGDESGEETHEDCPRDGGHYRRNRRTAPWWRNMSMQPEDRDESSGPRGHMHPWRPMMRHWRRNMPTQCTGADDIEGSGCRPGPRHGGGCRGRRMMRRMMRECIQQGSHKANAEESCSDQPGSGSGAETSPALDEENLMRQMMEDWMQAVQNDAELDQQERDLEAQGADRPVRPAYNDATPTESDLEEYWFGEPGVAMMVGITLI